MWDCTMGTTEQKARHSIRTLCLIPYIQRLGLTFSTSAQCTWYTNRRNLWNNGVPVSYIDQSGETHPFREEDKNNIQLQHLVEKYSATYFERTTVPFYMDINLKASKRIGKYLNLAFLCKPAFGYLS